MKKKSLIFIGIVVLLVIILAIVSQYYPPADETDTSGTIGKVEKYRKIQMTEKDIILRSEFISDTTALAKSIQGLIYFNVFAKEYSNDLAVYSNYLKQNEPKLKYVNELDDYVTFIKNNLVSVENTIGLLADFYSGDTTDYSLDVEKKLKEFDSFVYQMIKKDSVITSLIPELESQINKGNSNQNKKVEELNKLINIHDQLLLKNVLFGLIICNSEKLNIILNKELYNAYNIATMYEGQAKIEGYQLNNIKAFLSKDKLGIFNKEKLAFMNKENLGTLNKEKLGYIVLNTEKLGRLLNGEKLNILLSKVNNLNNAYKGGFWNKTLNSKESNLGLVNATEKLGAGFTNVVNKLGPIFYTNKFGSSEKLQSLLNSSLPNTIQNKLQGIELEGIELEGIEIE